MKKAFAAAALAAVLLTTGCSGHAGAQKGVVATAEAAVQSSTATVVVPNLVGETLDVAVKDLKALGLGDKATDVDKGKMIMMKSNWKVVTQDVPAGTKVDPGSKVNLGVHHWVDDAPTASPTPTATPTPTPTPSQTPKPSPAPVKKAAAPVPAPVAPLPPMAGDPNVPQVPSGVGAIICNDGYVWPGTVRRGACHGHHGIRN